MALVSSQLYREVLSITSQGVKPVHYRYEFEIIANGVTHKTLTGVAFSFLRNYLKDYAEDARVELLLPAGTFLYDILPYRRDLKIRIYGYPQHEVLDMEDKRAAPVVREYKAIPFDTGDATVNQANASAATKDTANLSTANVYTFQLIDPVVEQLRLVQIGGIYRAQTPGDLLRALLTHYSQRLEFPADQKPLGVGMVAPNNQEQRLTTIIPHGSPLVDQRDGTEGLARRLQYREGGIYNGGIAAFYQSRHWYVFPPFDVTRWETAKRKLTIANIAEKDLRQPERSYRDDGNNVYIIATGQVNYKDQSEHEQLNSGNGTRWSNSSKVFNGMLSGDGNTAKADRSSVMTEIVGDPNPQKLAYAPMAKQTISSNSCAQMTPLTFKRGSMIQLTWEHANLEILYPGMPARVLYERQGVIEMLDGVLVGAEISSAPTGKIGAKEGWLTNAALSLFVTRAKIDTATHTA